jgi:hypothetical protein
MHVPAHILQKAIALYLERAYPAPGGGVPAGVAARAEGVNRISGEAEVPLEMLERDAANSVPSYALRLGQPKYPHMKLVVDPAPPVAVGAVGADYMLRVDAHDRHLHAAPGSPDAAWLTAVRMSNKELGEAIEAAWAAAGLPTFKSYLKQQLAARKKGGGE